MSAIVWMLVIVPMDLKRSGPTLLSTDTWIANAASCTLLWWFQMADDPLNLECKYTEKVASYNIHMCLLYMLSPYAKNNRMFVFIGIQSAPNLFFR